MLWYGAAAALSPGPDVRCCAGQRAACGEHPPTPARCREILAAFDELSRSLYPEPGIASRTAALVERIGHTAWRNPRTAAALGFGIALLAARFMLLGRASLAGRVVFVAGGSTVTTALFWLWVAFRHG